MSVKKNIHIKSYELLLDKEKLCLVLKDLLSHLNEAINFSRNGYNTGLYSSGTSATIKYNARIKSNVDRRTVLISRSFVVHDTGGVANSAMVELV